VSLLFSSCKMRHELDELQGGFCIERLELKLRAALSRLQMLLE